ncbi:hypothetical protein OJAV_G00114980 [Oryzias javanicus]|uniref:Uncharacterized protein n=1 Tax=Oryzias javanicus TaxID=123683 RepID=A0A437CX68_ORYJA|nr:hypothetical protein OJAV_G00114980 [Oryzias javanicus]
MRKMDQSFLQTHVSRVFALMLMRLFVIPLCAHLKTLGRVRLFSAAAAASGTETTGQRAADETSETLLSRSL